MTLYLSWSTHCWLRYNGTHLRRRHLLFWLILNFTQFVKNIGKCKQTLVDMARFLSLRSLTTRNHRITSRCRNFDICTDGWIPPLKHIWLNGSSTLVVTCIRLFVHEFVVTGVFYSLSCGKKIDRRELLIKMNFIATNEVTASETWSSN